ncbi:hypothetical protein ACWNT8_15585 (plasmid) [Pigmentibacter ruber]|nr:hypothetical protein GTC16762_32650 [Pigmentibacter ruber]
MRSLVEIRKITYLKINNCIELINELNKILDLNSEEIKKEEENKNKISLPYLDSSIVLCENLISELKRKVYLVDYLSKKNNECIEKYNLLMEKIS